MTFTSKDLRTFLASYKIVALLMIIVVIWSFFGFLTYDADLGGSQFLTARNFSNLLRQMAITGMLASAMVFIIVAGEIDLSVGSLLGMLGGIAAVLDVMFHWPLAGTVAVVILLGITIGAFVGWLTAYQGIPSFIVTLGGLLIWSRVAYFVAGGQTIGPLDGTFLMLGGTNGTLGVGLSWALAAIAALGAGWALWSSRRAKLHHGFPVKPVWAEVTLIGIVVGLIAGFTAIINSNMVPPARLKRLFDARGEVMPEGYTEAYGIPISVLLLIIVALLLTVMALRTRLGRYIFATGGNPDAAELSGINTRLLTVKIFALMGGLCGLSAAVASARLSNHSLDIGTLDELRVIAAAVIGGTALAGGFGTVYGAILGALIMQSLQSGMAMVGVDAPFQNIVVGAVLVLAVWIDIQYRKRRGIKV